MRKQWNISFDWYRGDLIKMSSKLTVCHLWVMGYGLICMFVLLWVFWNLHQGKEVILYEENKIIATAELIITAFTCALGIALFIKLMGDYK